MDDGPHQKAWFYTDCPEADQTNRDTEPETESEDDADNQPVENVADNTEDQAGDKTSDNEEEAGDITNADTDDNQNVDLVNVCFEVTRTNAEDSGTTQPERLLLHKGLDNAGQQMFDNSCPKTTCVEVRPYIMPRIAYSSSDGVSF